MRARRAATAVAAFSALLTPVAPISGQEDAQTAPLVFQEVLDVRVVNIEVVVTDRSGERVHGLGVGDFRLRVDGEEVPIDYFSEIVGGEVVARPRAAGEQQGVAAVPSLEEGRPVGTSYLVFIDDFFSLGRDRDRMLDRLGEQIAEMRPEDRMAVVAYDGRRLEMLTSWTSSPRVIENALRKAHDRRAYGMHRMAELRQNDQDRADRRRLQMGVNAIAAGNADPNVDPEEKLALYLDPVEVPYAMRLTSQLERSINAAVATLRGFASPPGRKAMLLLAGGWPFSPAAYTVNDLDTEFADAVRADADNRVLGHNALFGPLADTANLLGYTLYPVDVPGLVREFRDASYETPDVGPIASNYSGFPREIGQHASLDFLAEQTGGRAMINAERDNLFDTVVRDTRSYYWLGFAPQRAGDDSHHDIQVEVLRPGLEARFRAGFLDFSRQSEQTMMVESSLLFGDPPSTTPLDLRFGRPDKSRGKMTVPLQVAIPMDEITMLPMSEGLYGADIELRVSVMDDRGERSDTPVAKIQIRGKEPPKPGQFFRYATELQMRKRRHRVIVAVWDPVGGAVMSSSIEITP